MTARPSAVFSQGTTPFNLTNYLGEVEKLKGLSEADRQFALNRMYPTTSSDDKFFQDYMNLVRERGTPEFMREQLKMANEFEQERLKQAYPYLLAKQIPETISQAMGAANALRLRGGERSVEAAMQGVEAIGRGQFVPYGALPEFRYFT